MPEAGIGFTLRPLDIWHHWISALLKRIPQRQMPQTYLETDMLFRTVADNGSDLILIVTLPELVIEYANRAFRSFTGFTQSALIGHNWVNFIDPDDHCAIQQFIESSLKSTIEGRSHKVRLKSAQPCYRRAEVRIFPLPTSTEVKQILVIGQLDQKHEISDVSDDHEEAELFINSVPSILIGLDENCNIKRWNSAAHRTFGLEKSAVVGKSFLSCGIKWLAPDMEEKIAAVKLLTNQIRWDGIWFEKEEQRCLLGLTVTRIVVGNNQQHELLVIGTDVTERRKAEEDLHSKTAFLEAQTNATLDGILVVDENNKKILQNKQVAEMFDVTQEIRECKDDRPLLGHVLKMVKNPEQFMDRVTYLYDNKELTSRDEIQLQNGKVLDRYSSPVIGKEGKYYGRIWAFRDITERKRNEEALKQLSTALDQSPVSVIITDVRGEITYVNRRFSECSGYVREEVVGQNPRILKSGNTPQEVYERLWTEITQGREWRGELQNRKKNGDLYWDSVVISPILDSQGRTTHFLAVKEDVTSRKLLEAQLQQVQKLEAIGQLAAGIAHEINTPMQFIGDNTRFVKQSWADLGPAMCLLQSLSTSDCTRTEHDQLRTILADADFDYLREEVPRALEESLDGIGRVTKIVQAMKEFSHPGSDEKQNADINKAILSTLTVARNE
ncbi:MAG TPA: PAS domain S-box protein, partial [Terriglobales bacterium]